MSVVVSRAPFKQLQTNDMTVLVPCASLQDMDKDELLHICSSLAVLASLAAYVWKLSEYHNMHWHILSEVRLLDVEKRRLLLL